MDGELVCRVLQLMQLTDNRLTQVNDLLKTRYVSVKPKPRTRTKTSDNIIKIICQTIQKGHVNCEKKVWNLVLRKDIGTWLQNSSFDVNCDKKNYDSSELYEPCGKYRIYMSTTASFYISTMMNCYLVAYSKGLFLNKFTPRQLISTFLFINNLVRCYNCY